MRAFSGFIIVSHDGFASLAAVKPKLNSLRPVWGAVRQLPHGSLDNAAIGENRLGVQNQSRLDDGSLYHNSLGGNTRANVVLPAPLGPAMMTIFFWAVMRLMKSYTKRYPLGRRWRDGEGQGSHVAAKSLMSMIWSRVPWALVKPRRRVLKAGR